ncbi:hypothetical protein [Tessaracoccus massiliensis]|uniref:hypothetical protein n=1 Tax=Tessaracoccus massiliensis TaxID=1522311 RepID=UPI00058EEE50|nr:hypothetical protein [Tessaracoccus massiliensis]
MTDTPENVELADAQYRHRLTLDIHARAAELRNAIADIDASFPDPATLDVHAILYAVLEAADRPLDRAVHAARLEIAYLAGEMQRPQPTVRHRDAITGQYVDADEAAARPETTIRETRKP